MKKIFFLGMITICALGCINENDSNIFKITTSNERKYAEEVLQEVLTKNQEHNVVDSNTYIIETPETALKVVEPILFGIYGERNIIKQRPYEISDFKDHYVIEGVLHSGFGGTFLIIINKKNAEIIKITHGK